MNLVSVVAFLVAFGVASLAFVLLRTGLSRGSAVRVVGGVTLACTVPVGAVLSDELLPRPNGALGAAMLGLGAAVVLHIVRVALLRQAAKRG